MTFQEREKQFDKVRIGLIVVLFISQVLTSYEGPKSIQTFWLFLIAELFLVLEAIRVLVQYPGRNEYRKNIWYLVCFMIIILVTYLYYGLHTVIIPSLAYIAPVIVHSKIRYEAKEISYKEYKGARLLNLIIIGIAIAIYVYRYYL